jgi:hypothetical protein
MDPVLLGAGRFNAPLGFLGWRPQQRAINLCQVLLLIRPASGFSEPDI